MQPCVTACFVQYTWGKLGCTSVHCVSKDGHFSKRCFIVKNFAAHRAISLLAQNLVKYNVSGQLFLGVSVIVFCPVVDPTVGVQVSVRGT